MYIKSYKILKGYITIHSKIFSRVLTQNCIQRAFNRVSKCFKIVCLQIKLFKPYEYAFICN